MKVRIIAIVSILVFSSCQQEKPPGEILIEGQVENVPNGKIYLAEAHHWMVPLDSTISQDGHFAFRIQPDSGFTPYMATLYFQDSSKPSKIGILFFRNYMMGRDSLKYAGTGFYLERGTTTIRGDNQSQLHLRVFAGRETDLMYIHQFTDFGRIFDSDPAKRAARIAFFQNEITKNPKSYFLLQNIFEAKEQYTEKELKDILALFHPSLFKSSLGDKFRTYLSLRPTSDKPYPNLFLSNREGSRHFIIDSAAPLNMLVFWASWCGPCRSEIPSLKEIQVLYKGRGLNLVSISIDESHTKWEKALDAEKMPWPQFIVDLEKIDSVKQQYNFSAIPLVVFTDGYGKEIAKFLGYAEDQKTNYLNIISRYIR